MPVYFGSGAPSVTAAQVETAFNNLRSKSPKFESMFQEMMRSGYDLHIRVVDGNALPGNSHITPPGRADIYAVFGAAGSGKGTIVFTEQALKETNYITNYGTQANAILTLERVIAHEMAHAHQHATGKPFTGDAAEEKAAQVENEVMGAFGEAPRQGDPSHPTLPTYHDSSVPVPPRPVHGYPAEPAPPPAPMPVDDGKEKLGAGENQKDPLVLDLDHSGTIDLISLTNSTGYFDHDNDGFSELAGLVAAEDGYLALDLNSNGQIDAGELFGTANISGFSHLAQYDSNDDGQITAEDAVWGDLIIWQDHNENGYSEGDELYTLADHDIIAISLVSSSASTTNQGHSILNTGSFTVDTGSGTASYAIHEVGFQYDDTNTIYVGDYNLDIAALLLSIDQRGYGILPKLHISMSMDNVGSGNLLELVTDFSELTLAQIFDGTDNTVETVRDIMFRWAGVDGISPTSRGSYVDARELAFLEKLYDNPFRQGGHQPNPMYNASIDINSAFKQVFNHIYANIVAQAAGGELFEGDWYYDSHADVFEGVTGIDLTVLAGLESVATGLSNTSERQLFWESVVRMVDGVIGIDNLDVGDLAALQGAITSSDATLDLEDDIMPPLSVEAEPFNSGADQTVIGSSGDDSLFGYAGNDWLRGLSGNDILNGGTGADTLEGHIGNDTYVYNDGDGDDVIIEYSGSDVISFGAGITAGDITISRAMNDMRIDIDTGVNTGIIYVADFFTHSNNIVETILFADTSTIDLTTLNWTYVGTDGNDTMHGARWGTGDIDTIYGGDGNDKIYGYDGNDTLYGGNGDDHIEGGDGADTLYGGDGNDRLEGGSGNDILYDGAGNDYVHGGSGDDTFYYGGGHDTFIGATTETIILPPGFTSGNAVYYKIGSAMKIVLDQDNTITIPSYASAGFTVVFDGGPSVLLTSVTPIVQGDDGNNTLTGTSNTDYLYGNGGNDALNGNNGNDFLYGGTGNDSLNGGYGNDWLEGGAGNDLMAGGNDDDIYVFTSGHDEIYDLSGADELRFIAGWTAEDLTFSRDVTDLYDLLISVNAGNSIVITNQFYGNDQVETLRFADNSTMDLMTIELVTYGNNSNNSISGIGSGASANDVIYGYGGNDTINASNGNDIIYGGDGDDDIDGGNDNDVLYGEDGNDKLAGASGNDWLEGGVGNDYMAGGNGNDIYIYTSGHDEIYELSGDDELRLVDGWTMENFTFNRNFGALNDLVINIDGSNSILITNQFYGSDNIERFRFADNSTVNLTSVEVTTHGNSSNNSISGILNGASTNDTIYGYGGNDTLSGGAGNDKLYGGDGNDTLTGGDGADLLDGGVGDDSLTGGTGDDIFVYTAGIDTVADTGGADTLRMGSGIDVNAITFSNVSTNHTKITVTASIDEVTINNLRHGTAANHVDFIEFADGFRTSLPDYASWVHGTGSNDLIAYTSADETILAKGGNDTVQAGGGHDDVHGGAGDDVLYGEAGNDLLHGGEGNDTLYGGDGLDTLFGGVGDDIFVFETASAFNNIDVIKDFSLTDDAIDISDLLSSYDPLNDLLADWVEMTTSGTDTILSVDRDGAGGTYSMTQIATIQGVTGLTDEAALVTNGNLIVT